MAADTRQFGFWYQGAPVLIVGDGRGLSLWRNGSPLLLTGVTATVWVVVASGGVVTAGTAALERDMPHVASGGLTLGGAATHRFLVHFPAHVGTGGLDTGGDSEDSHTLDHLATGGLVLGGGAPVVIHYKFFSEGGSTVLGGGATHRFLTHWTPHVATGGLTTGGNGNLLRHYNTSPPAVVCGSYNGDGTGARTITGLGIVPSVIWVLGKSASGQTIGAFWIRGMPDGTSHPWAKNKVPGDSTRSNRITGAVRGGFTVGTTLNASGESYYYVAFPAADGALMYGAYEGSGLSMAISVSLATNVGAGTFFLGGAGGFTQAEVGRKIYKVSDWSLIGTISAVQDATHATGTVVQGGSFPSGTHQFEPRMIPLGFAAEFVLVMADDNTGTVTEPVVILPGDPLMGGLRPPNAAQMCIVSGFSQGNNDVGLAVGETNLQVVNTVGAAGYDLAGVTYRWVAFSTNLPILALHVLRWTGDGAQPRAVTATLGFIPTFAAMFSHGATMRWKESAGAFTTGSNGMPFSDGVAATDAGTAFLTNGLTLNPAIYNTNGQEAVALLARGSTIPQTGGLTSGGGAHTRYKIASGPASGYWLPIGGLTIAHTHALQRVRLVDRLWWEPDGGLTLDGTASGRFYHRYIYGTTAGGLDTGGAAAVARGRAWQATGGADTGGDAAEFLKAHWTYAASGGLIAAGAATIGTNIVSIAPGPLSFRWRNQVQIAGRDQIAAFRNEVTVRTRIPSWRHMVIVLDPGLGEGFNQDVQVPVGTLASVGLATGGAAEVVLINV